MQADNAEEGSPGHYRLGTRAFSSRLEYGLSLIERGQSVVLMQGYEPVAVVRPVSEQERAYYAEQAARSRRRTALATDLLETFADRLPADRLPADRLDQYRTFSDVGEWSELVSNLIASLVQRQTPVTAGEHRLLAELLGLFRPSPEGYPWLHGDNLAAVNVIGDERDLTSDNGS